MIGALPLVSRKQHRTIDQLTFPGLLAAAAWISRWDKRAAAVTLATAAVEGTAYLTTDYPPAVLPLLSYRTHNRWAATHGALVITLALTMPGLTRRGRLALCVLGSAPISLALLSDMRGSEAGEEAEGPRSQAVPSTA
jgi:hypothetical protein